MKDRELGSVTQDQLQDDRDRTGLSKLVRDVRWADQGQDCMVDNVVPEEDLP